MLITPVACFTSKRTKKTAINYLFDPCDFFDEHTLST